MRPRPGTLLAGMLLALLLCGSPRVESGTCIGADRARVVRLFEILSYRMQSKMSEWENSLRAVLAELPRQAFPLALFVSDFQYKHQSRELVRRLLSSGTYQPERISGELKKLADRALVLAELTAPEQELPAEWRQEFVTEFTARWHRLFPLVAGAYRVCQAVRQKKLDVCTVLAPLEQNLKRDCESQTLRVGMLYSGHCSDEAARLIAVAWNREPRTIQLVCQAIKEQRKESCADVPGILPADLSWCRAMAGGGETACNSSVMGKDHLRECQNEVRVQQAAIGKLPLSTFTGAAAGNSLLVPALSAVRSSIACDELALDVYDRLSETPGP